MTILDGKELSQKVKKEVKQEVEQIKKKGIIPGLAVILVGSDPASKIYVTSKEKACIEAGIYSEKVTMNEDATQERILNKIDKLNKDENIHGILVQLPLPSHMDKNVVLQAINPKKDVDGFHALNVGNLCLGNNSLIPCTPLGIMRILEEYEIEVEGKDVCVIGASNIVGKPLASLLTNKEATVTLCHIKTKDLTVYTKNADIIIVATGVPNLLKEDMVKDGVIVIDVGINRLENGKIVGDVDFENVSKKCSYITPVPGGVGPMTIAMLLQNTLQAAKMSEV